RTRPAPRGGAGAPRPGGTIRLAPGIPASRAPLAACTSGMASSPTTIRVGTGDLAEPGQRGPREACQVDRRVAVPRGGGGQRAQPFGRGGVGPDHEPRVDAARVVDLLGVRG